LLTRVNHARDWGSGVELSNTLLGRFSSLEVHHIFPKSTLYKKGYQKHQVNALGNYAFLTSETNGSISNKDPIEYIPEFIRLNPGAVESHWMPTDSYYFEIDNYMEFLIKRRELLADSTNSFLNSLINDSVDKVEIRDYTNRTAEAECQHEEDVILIEVSRWMSENGLHEGESNYQLTDEEGNELAIIDLAWPQGIQAGLSEPLALLINECSETQEVVNENGYKYFTYPDAFKAHISAQYLD